jgi:hypothetical protein
MDTRRIGRRAAVAGVAAALAGAGPLGRLARAETVKEGVLKGCREGGHSPVDNRDGSYQCNLRDGGEIRCTTKDQCTYVPPAKAAPAPGGVVDVGGVIDVGEGGGLADPLVPVGSVLELPALGITLVVAAPRPERRRHKGRRR